MITVLIPCHNEASVIPVLIRKIQTELQNCMLVWEILIIDDGSEDNTVEVIKEMQKKIPQLRLLEVGYNLGQYEAIKWGVNFCEGNWVVVMDADGQDDATMLPALYHKAKESQYDAVFGERMVKQYPWFKVLTSQLFHTLISILTWTPQNHKIAGFGMYRKTVLLHLAKQQKQLLYLPLMRQWKPYKISTLPVVHQPRISGRSSYSFAKQLQLGMKILRDL
jgi:polyisoprenyl-phosphate glycosyltransferase